MYELRWPREQVWALTVSEQSRILHLAFAERIGRIMDRLYASGSDQAGYTADALNVTIIPPLTADELEALRD